MNVKFRGVVGFALAGLASACILLGLVYHYSPATERDGVVASGAIEMIAQATGLLIAISGALFYGWLEMRSNNRDTERRIDDAHKRIVNEIDDLIHSATDLLANPKEDGYTLLPNDVWHTSRELLLEAHAGCNDSMDYALQDFYNRVRLLQKADAERVSRMGRGDNNLAATITRDSTAVIKMGQYILKLMEADGYKPSQHPFEGDIAKQVESQSAA